MDISHYGQYLLEREGISILENEYGFVTYSITDNNCFIYDMFITKEHRLNGNGVKLVNELVGIAKSLKAEYLFCTCIPSTVNSTESMKAILSYNFTLHSSKENEILFKKRI